MDLFRKIHENVELKEPTQRLIMQVGTFIGIYNLFTGKLKEMERITFEVQALSQTKVQRMK